MAREVRVAILGDSRDYHRAVTDAVRDSDRLDRSFKDVNTSADRSFRGIGESASRMKAVVATAAVGAGIALGGFVISAIRSASDLQETISLTNTVFGDVAPFVQNWAQGAARGFGQSRQAALRTAGAFGNLFRQTGFTNRRAATLAMTMTELASDFASFHNADTVQVTEAMTAAFRGEYDALQRFVPTINAAAVQQEALRQTGKRHAEDLTIQEKALATYTLMMDGAGDAMGDFDRTSGGLANQQRILGAQWEDLKAKIGEKFLPVATAVVTWANEKLPEAFETARRWIDNVSEGWDVLTTELFGEGESGWDDLLARHDAGWQEFQRLYDDYIRNLGLGWDVFTTKIFGEGESGWDDIVRRHKDGTARAIEVFGYYWGAVQTGFNNLAEWGHRNAPWFFGEGPGKTVGDFGAPKGNAADWANVSPFAPVHPIGPVPAPIGPVRLPPPTTPIAGPFQEGGIMPGPRGSHSLALVAGGETILPTHRQDWGGGITLVVNGEPDDFTLRRLRLAAIDAAEAVHRAQAWSVS